MHKNGDKNIKTNDGTFIGELMNKINKDFNNNIRNIIIILLLKYILKIKM